ncbi:ubiquitin carboxyl-terminal hydrolase 10 isoform X3 [Brachionus plicatilis]|uniref:ubiquitinyl hydrolase 1 n=1 Tax=Brachionus plicatilis TaxID=10195 RepID=A0A3M7R550_BRAPC|nr:ubiquitin carboxyl-terminal hydrolase 10 isoform X3 [Brachionus plicatilis]
MNSLHIASRNRIQTNFDQLLLGEKKILKCFDIKKKLVDRKTRDKYTENNSSIGRLECQSDAFKLDQTLSNKLRKESGSGMEVTNLPPPSNTNTEQQRRNKKKKPPNYYQNEEIAAILKKTDSLVPGPTTEMSNTSPSPQSSERKHLEPDSATNQLSANDTVKAFEEAKTEENEEEKSAPASNWPASEASNKSWSSLFKSRQLESASQKSQTKPVQCPKAVVVQHTNSGYSQSSSSSSISASLSSNSDQNLTESFKTIANFLKSCELKHSAPALQPRGIRNKQNWCYVNATLQALLACPPFYNLIKSIYGKMKSSNANMQAVPFVWALGRFINEFKVMVRSASNTDQVKLSASNGKELVIGDPFEIDYFYETLSLLKSEIAFKSGRQEDAQEFLSFLLNRVHEEMVKCLDSLSAEAAKADNVPNGSGNPREEINNNNQEDADEWKEVGKKNRALITRKTEFKQSPLSDIFCGQFRSALSQTGFKDKESASLEPFFTLPLDIQSDSVRNISQALENFVQREEVHGLTNNDTKQEVEAFKRISFEDLPPVLILYLKCFVYDKYGGIQKLLKRVDFQIDLEISKELISSGQRSKLKDKRSKYKLFAVEYHYGDKATGGHYITDVYHPGIISWVRYDDANVRICNNQQVLRSEDKKLVPYLLYYRRADLI